MFKSLVDLFQQKVDTSTGIQTENRIELSAAVLMLEIGLADADFDDTERAAVKNILTTHFSQSEKDADELISTAIAEVDKAVSLHDFTRFLNETLEQTEKVELIEVLWRVAFADAVLDKYEEYYLRKIADLLYISHSDYIKAKHKVADTIKK